MKATLYKHQQEIVDMMPKKWLLHHDCGTGKTITALALAEKIGKPTLVICLKSLVEVWKEAIGKFADNPQDFIVISKENFKKLHQELPKYDVVVVDEMHFFLGMTSQLYKSLIWYLDRHQPSFFYGLTGTAYRSSPWNVFCIGHIFSTDKFGRITKWNYWKFRRTFFNDVSFGKRKVAVPKKNIEPIIAGLINSFGNSVTIEECVDMPPKIYQEEYFSLTSEQRAAIKAVVDPLSIVRYTKISQIENGVLKGDGYTKDQYFKSEKLKRIMELCEENSKLAIVCRYNMQIKHIHDELVKKGEHRPIYIINGDTPDKNAVVNKINDHPEAIVLIQSATGTGYNLWSVSLMVFASNSFSYVDRYQVEDRIRRINHPQKCRYIDLLTEGDSIDRAVLNNLLQKKDFNLEVYAKERG